MVAKRSDDELLENLKEIAKELGRAPKREELTKYGKKIGRNGYDRVFGSFSKALEAAGLTPNMNYNKDEKYFLDLVFDVYKKINKQPTIYEFEEHTGVSYLKINRLFLSKEFTWKDFCVKAGIPKEELIKAGNIYIRDEQIKEDIIRLKEKFGRYPSYQEVDIYGAFSAVTYANKYGSFTNAFKVLGFEDYKPMESQFENQTYTTARDGIRYKSSLEGRVADILLDMKNKNKIKDYKYEELVCADKRWTCDFVVEKNNGSKLYIETDGMEDRRKHPYKSGTNPKINYYTNNNFNFIIVEIKADAEEEIEKAI